MNEEHQKLGFYYSIALHLSVVVAVVVSVFLKSLFPEKHQENTLVFEMVDLPQNTPMQQQETPSQQQEAPDITTPDV